MSAQEDLMLVCLSGGYCFSQKGFNSHFIETDRAIHHSQVHVDALFRQCQRIIAQLKEWALHTSKNYLHFISSFFLSHFLEQDEAVSLVFLSAQAPPLLKDMDESE